MSTMRKVDNLGNYKELLEKLMVLKTHFLTF